MMHHMSLRAKIIVMLAVMSGLFLVALDQTIIATALTAIVDEFHNYDALGFIVTAYLLTSTVMVPIAGKLSDMYGRRPMLLIGVAVFVIGSLLSGIAPNVEWLVADRAFQGIGGGIIMANAFTVVGDLFSPRERGRWQGFIGAVFGVSSAVGPLLGGWLTDGINILGVTTDWRWTFFINIPVGIIAFAAITRYLPNFRHESEHHPDYKGATWLVVALASVVLAVDNTEAVFAGLVNVGWSVDLIKWLLYAIAAVSVAAFVAIERRAKDPVLPLKFFKSRTYSLMVTATVLFGAAFLGAILYLTQFNQQVFGVSASEAGLMLLPMTAGMMISSITIGQFVAKIGKYKVFIVTGFIIGTLSILSLITLGPGSSFIYESVIMFVAGIGLGMAMPILSLAVQNEFEQKYIGAATSSVQLFRGLGSTVGTALLSGMLTTGILTAIGSPQSIPYIQTLQQSPASAKILGSDIDANTLLQINTMRGEIASQASDQLSSQHLPTDAKNQVLDNLHKQQSDFSNQVIDAFSSSLHRIFIVSGALMAVSVILMLFIKERPLRGSFDETPAED